MSRKLAGIYAAGSTAIAVLAIVVASSMFGLFAPADPAAPDAEAAADVTVDVAPAYSSALGDLEAMRAAALNDVAAQVAAQRAALQEQALRDVEAQRAALQAQAVSSIEAERAAAYAALAAEVAANRSRAQAAVAPNTAAPAAKAPATSSAIVVATPVPTSAPRTVSAEAQAEVAKKSAECDRKRGEDRTECLRELAKLKARYGL